MGVRVVARSADLTVVLVNDYLEWGLAELNLRMYLTGRPGCWSNPPALSHWWACVHPGRDGLLDLSFRPHDPQSRGQRFSRARRRTRRCYLAACSQYPRTERHPACRRGNRQGHRYRLRTELRNHIVSLDLLGSTVAKHYVAHRPQCPTCGSKKLLDPRRAPAPIELSAGAKLVMTSGGYRSVTSRATVERFRKHVSR